MIYTSENNWYEWSYDDNEKFGLRTSKEQQFKTCYTRSNNIIEDFKTELHKTARSTLDHYPGLRPCVFFSGGVDSEAILRAYIEIGSNPLVYIVRYENDYNIYDVSYAITICTMLGIDYNLIDFNLKKFYENDAETVSEQAQICRPRMLPHLKFTECADGLIIVGHSDMAWFRTSADYLVPAKWKFIDFEHDIGCDKYNIYHNRPAIYQWFKWSPGIVLGYTKMKWFQNLIHDAYYGKTGINSTKIMGYRESYPDFIERRKQTGFEKIDPIVAEVEQHFIQKYNGLPYRGEVIRTIEELWIDVTGNVMPE